MLDLPSDYCGDVLLVNGTAGRQGWLRRLGQEGWAEPMVTPGTTGRTSREGSVREEAMWTFEVVPGGWVSSKDQIGCVPLGAETVSLIRDPAR
jgi:hypothetical protein